MNLVLLHLTRKLGHLIGMARRLALSIMLKNVFSVCICNVLSVLKCATQTIVTSECRTRNDHLFHTGT